MGTKDTVAPVVVAHRIKAGVASSHLSFIYGAAHSLEFDAPERVGTLISGFLERGEAFVVRGTTPHEASRPVRHQGSRGVRDRRGERARPRLCGSDGGEWREDGVADINARGLEAVRAR
jgi:hypothetical protein